MRDSESFCMACMRLMASLDRVLGVEAGDAQWVALTDELIKCVGVPVGEMPSGSAAAFADVVGALARAVVDSTVGFYKLSFLRKLKRVDKLDHGKLADFSSMFFVTSCNHNSAVVLYQYEIKLRDTGDDNAAKKLAQQLISTIERYNGFKEELGVLFADAQESRDYHLIGNAIHRYKSENKVYSIVQHRTGKIEAVPAYYESCRDLIAESCKDMTFTSETILLFFGGFVQVSSKPVFDAAIHESAMCNMVSYSIERLVFKPPARQNGLSAGLVHSIWKGFMGLVRLVGELFAIVATGIMIIFFCIGIWPSWAGWHAPLDSVLNGWSYIYELLTGRYVQAVGYRPAGW